MAEPETMDEPKEVEKQISPSVEEGDSPNPPLVIKRWRIWKNLLIICIAWVLLFTAFQGIANLQSSLNVKGDVGMNSMAIIYAFLIFSSAFLPHAMMSIFGMKWTIVISQFGYLAFIAANLYAQPALMYPASILVGLGGAPLWTSQSSYVTQIGTINAELKGKKPETGITQFLGVFFAFFQTSQIWGNMISYFVFGSTAKPLAESKQASNASSLMLIDSNHTSLLSTSKIILPYQCGAQFSDKEFVRNITNTVAPKLVSTLCYIYIALAITSIILIAALLDQRRTKTDSKTTIKATLKNSVHHLASTFKHLRHRNQLLLIPFTLWSGLEQTYISAQFTKGFITCAVGIKYVGLVMIVFGVCDALSSFAFGHVAKYVRRIYCLIFAAAINYALIITMMIWVPSEEQLWVLFILAGLWGVADGCWQTQIGAAYGVLFTEHESAFSNFRLWESLGYVIAYIYTPRIRIKYAHIILLCVLTLSMICYGVIDFTELRRKKQEAKDKPAVAKDEAVPDAATSL